MFNNNVPSELVLND